MLFWSLSLLIGGALIWITVRWVLRLELADGPLLVMCLFAGPAIGGGLLEAVDASLHGWRWLRSPKALRRPPQSTLIRTRPVGRSTKITLGVGLACLSLPIPSFIWPLLALATHLFPGESMAVESARALTIALLLLYGVVVIPGFLGIMILGFCTDAAGYRPPWLYYVMIFLGLIWLVNFPSGTMVGLALLAYALLNRGKFVAPPESS
ncbi:MAG TPA: hypothetical protein DCY13_04785 [Verrucomicrobiales bacterium]|nr:hypothetical protein [Verrucomicrobiales bacterium]